MQLLHNKQQHLFPSVGAAASSPLPVVHLTVHNLDQSSCFSGMLWMWVGSGTCTGAGTNNSSSTGSSYVNQATLLQIWVFFPALTYCSKLPCCGSASCSEWFQDMQVNQVVRKSKESSSNILPFILPRCVDIPTPPALASSVVYVCTCSPDRPTSTLFEQWRWNNKEKK